jgi:cytochrome b
MSERILVWDLPLRIFHWALAASVFGALVTAESERLRDVHVMLGYTALGLVAFRIVWGFVGTRYARFAAFLHGPAALRSYVASLLNGRPERHVGHNPPGALAIPVLLSLTAATGLSGWAVFEEVGGEWLEEAHEALAFTLLAAIAVHVVGVVASSFLHRENLVLSMITGRKHGAPGEAIGRPRRGVALLLGAAIAGFWLSVLTDRGRPPEPSFVEARSAISAEAPSRLD